MARDPIWASGAASRMIQRGGSSSGV